VDVKDRVKAVVEALDEAAPDAPVSGCGGPPAAGCSVPQRVVYVIFSRCVTINNGACPDWEFCQPCTNQPGYGTPPDVSPGC